MPPTPPAPEPVRPSVSGGAPAPAAALQFDDPLSRPAADDSDRGWGERPADTSDADLTRFLEDKPPHHV